MGRPFMTGRVHYTPEALQQLDELDQWITENGSAAVARSFVSAVMDHCESIPMFPRAGRIRPDVRAGIHTTTFRKRTTIAYEVDDSSGKVVINILGVFHGGQDWENWLRSDSAETDGV
ncbi:type II toxin-antitoxin system RelE/ParE family toxin [Microlunatus elymi]|uniref:Type II toxin-antitoxin system RelE/ParE family toxin n=1 Tax=Microlunatus elymi TaxID=2596828 RepID=A0A516Q2S0_9ACTN|nr:type II toxin-antitoxin system RelE/ParE family toxin [Microlunatus elymi]QDP97725.1 type II toxin-antitoxin system RelE/ParE family toxin [Microlunatus elymi]